MPSLAGEFLQWWEKYPKKIGRLAAEKAYQKARKRGATAAELLEGVERYKQHLPSDRQFICFPTTFLNQGRYLDEPDEPEATALKPSEDDGWFHECQVLHDGACGGSMNHRTRMLIDAEKGKCQQ